MRTLIGIDTGAKGAIAILLPDGTRSVYDLPAHPVALYNLLNNTAELSRDTIHIAIESLTGGHGAGSKASFFTQGVNYGTVLAITELFAAETQDCFIHMVKPADWQKTVTRLKPKALGSYTLWKKHLAALAKTKYAKTTTTYNKLGDPKKTLTSDACDALLILEHLERQYA